MYVSIVTVHVSLLYPPPSKQKSVWGVCIPTPLVFRAVRVVHSYENRNVLNEEN